MTVSSRWAQRMRRVKKKKKEKKALGLLKTTCVILLPTVLGKKDFPHMMITEFTLFKLRTV